MENWGLLLMDEDRFLVNEVGPHESNIFAHSAGVPVSGHGRAHSRPFAAQTMA